MKKNIIPFPTVSAVSTEDTLHAKLRFAIANRRLIQFTYDDESRVAEPHDYGIRNGSEKVLAYQRRKVGQFDKRATGWRWLEPSKIDGCVVLDDTFPGTREDAHQHHHGWDVLFARVD